MPPVVARPCRAVVSLKPPQVAPPAALPSRWSGSTVTDRMPVKSATTAPSAVPKPGTLCPPPRTASSVPVSPAYRTTAATSWAVVQRTTACGRASIIAL